MDLCGQRLDLLGERCVQLEKLVQFALTPELLLGELLAVGRGGLVDGVVTGGLADLGDQDEACGEERLGGEN